MASPIPLMLAIVLILTGCAPKEGVPKPKTVPDPGKAVSLVGVYDIPSFKKKIRGASLMWLEDSERIVVLREPLPLRAMFWSHRAEDEHHGPLDIATGRDSSMIYAFICVLKGYGQARKSASLIVRYGSKTALTVPVGPLPESPRLLSAQPPKNPRFVCNRWATPPASAWSTEYTTQSNLTVSIRTNPPDNVAYTFRVLGGDRCQLNSPNYGFGSSFSSYGGTGPVRLHNAQYQNAVKLQVRHFRKKIVEEEVTLTGAKIETVFGKPIIRVDRALVATSKAGVTITLVKQFYAPKHKPKNLSRTLLISYLTTHSRAYRAFLANSLDQLMPMTEIRLVGPKPEEVNVDMIWIDNTEHKAMNPTHGPYRNGPVTLRFKAIQTLWKLAKTETVVLPIEPPVGRLGPVLPPKRSDSGGGGFPLPRNR